MVFDCVDLPEVIIKDQPYLPPPAHITKTYYEGQPSRLSSEQLHCYRPSTRQSLTFDPIPTYIERSPRSTRSPRCSRSPIRNRSRCSTPSYIDRPSTPCTLSSRPQLCFTNEIPIEKSRPGGSRYKSLVCTKRGGDEDIIYNDKYDKYEQLRERERERDRLERDYARERDMRDRERQYATYSKSYQPVVYENLEKNSSSKNNQQDFEIVPNERVYEIRKEKLLIKADRNSQSPPRSRARSSDRYLDSIPASKNSRIIDDSGNQIIVPSEKYIYTTNSDSKRQLQSRSGYYITTNDYKLDDDIIDYNNNRYTNDQLIDKRLMYAAAAAAASNNNLNKKYESSNPNLTSYSNILPNNNNSYNNNSNNNSSSNSSSNNIPKQQSSPSSPQSQQPPSIVNVVSPSNEIVYVPMVKDEFIKRESQKLDCSGTNSNSANNNNNTFRRF